MEKGATASSLRPRQYAKMEPPYPCMLWQELSHMLKPAPTLDILSSDKVTNSLTISLAHSTLPYGIVLLHIAVAENATVISVLAR